MKDRELRRVVKKRILRNLRSHPDAFLLEELSIRRGSARIDMVVVNGSLHGIELKSDSDSLYRLPDQIEQFNSVFDKITLVVGYRHAFSALKMVPEWWGVKLAHVGERGAIHLSDARPALKNPIQNSRSIASLLWRDEAIMLLGRYGELEGMSSKSHSEICDNLANCLDSKIIRNFVIERFQIRSNWLADALQK